MKTFFCEICGKEHDGTYGSGRFCSPKCRSTNNILKVKKHVCNFHKKEDLKKLHLKNISEEKWKCVHCGICFPTKRKLYTHVKIYILNILGLAEKGLGIEVSPKKIMKVFAKEQKHINVVLKMEK